MKQKILALFFSILFLSSFSLHAQKEATWWYFGAKAGLNFRDTQTLNGVSNVPTLDVGPVNTGEGCFSISDKDGNFLFASDGMNVYNKNKVLMENGTGLLGHPSSAQSGIVIPMPGDPLRYYIVTVSAMEGPRNGLTYNIVDLSYNSGLGSITVKNQPLPGISATEKANMYENMSVVGHTNGVDYWLIQRARRYFYVWRVTSSGFSTPQLFDTGVDQGVYRNGILARAGMGYIKFSPDGTKVIHMDAAERNNASYITFADFDPASGIVSHIKNITTNIQSLYGVEFSPNGQYVFMSTHTGATTAHRGLYIKHVDELVEPSVTLSRVESTIENVQIAMDGRIYAFANHYHLFAILDPDMGPASPIVQFANFFPSTAYAGLGIPPFITSFFRMEDIKVSLPPCMKDATFSVNVNPGSGTNRITKLVWDFGDGTPTVTETDMSMTTFVQTHTYPQTGTYTVTLTPYNAANAVITEKVKTVEVVIAPCVLPDNISDADCFANPVPTEWSMQEATLNKTKLIHNYMPLLTGDIDGDGVVEIVGGMPKTGSQNGYDCDGIRIFTYDGTQVLFKKDIPFAGHTASTWASMAMVRYNDTGYIVALGASNRRLYAYNAATGEQIWQSEPVATLQSSMNITDFNSDGIPEVYIANLIFSLPTGALLCSGGNNNKGLMVYGGYNLGACFTVAADITGNGKLDLCAGTQVYEVNIPQGATTAGAGTMTVSIELPEANIPTMSGKDGTTTVADIDNDGQLEVIVSTSVSSGTNLGNRVVVYVWKPNPDGSVPSLLGSYLVPATNVGYYAIPMIGNIDSDAYPEILFITNGSVLNMYALEYNPLAASGNQISQKWTLTHTDSSGGTGMTLFDFNLDGVNEIVYRDQTELRIINGNTNSPDALTTVSNVWSGTLRELPVVADVDGDGHAEIVVTGYDIVANIVDGILANNQNSYLRVFETGGSPWAPARKVWNQYAYNAVNVNNDLTIPRYQLNPATLFPGTNGILGDTDDVRPYNNFMQQQTALSRNGTPLWLAPKGEITGTPVFSLNHETDEMQVTVKVTNTGDASFVAPFYVTAYKDDNDIVDTEKFVYTYSNPIAIGETATITFSIPNFGAEWASCNNIVLKINDSGNNENEQAACGTDEYVYVFRSVEPLQQAICMEKEGMIAIRCDFTLPTGANIQWQTSRDQVAWTDILGATSAEYMPSNKKRGTFYYRLKVIVGSTIVYSVPSKLRVKSCRIPVNHNISVSGWD